MSAWDAVMKRSYELAHAHDLATTSKGCVGRTLSTSPLHSHNLLASGFSHLSGPQNHPRGGGWGGWINTHCWAPLPDFLILG